ncbi:TetR/AcrR family transcriptional regulator [Amycolatopsis balhimycina DSM 5908]|uniref:TetR/AcrR family transcriptional regulator n=2 Tax=Amycolatopsis balhimycina TaxID=208443 RepID=A0A428WV59_AMYBA|nr:TetR/AcrR family transcriptional regulator [Amycolatopsis balhimycina DSM 5908]
MTAGQRRETILVAATAAFAEHGYQRAKASEIAARVGVSEPVVFQNFGSKAELFAAVLEQAAGTAVTFLTALTSGDRAVSEVLRALLAPEHLDALHAPGALGVLFVEGTASGSDPVVRQAARTAIRRVARGFAGLLEAGRRAGDLRADLDPDVAAWSLISFVASRALRRAVVDDPDIEGRLVESLLAQLRP